MLGATTLIIAISERASLLPTVSILYAALSVSRRAWSIMQRDSAMRSCQIDCSDSGLPNATRSDSRSIIDSSARSAAPIERMQWWMRPGPRRPCAISKPRPSPSRMVETGTRTSSSVDLHVAVRRVVVAEHRQRAHDGDARRVARHQHHRLLRVARRAGVGLAHHDEDRAARVAGAGAEPLAAVDHVLVAFAADRALDVGGVRRGHRGLGHQERRADLAGQQRLAASALLRLGGVALQRLHVAGVGRRAVEHLARPHHAAHQLAQRRVVEVGDAALPFVRMRQEQVPQAFAPRDRLELVDDLRTGPTRCPRVDWPRPRAGSAPRWDRCAGRRTRSGVAAGRASSSSIGRSSHAPSDQDRRGDRGVRYSITARDAAASRKRHGRQGLHCPAGKSVDAASSRHAKVSGIATCSNT